MLQGRSQGHACCVRSLITFTKPATFWGSPTIFCGEKWTHKQIIQQREASNQTTSGDKALDLRAEH